MTAVCQRWRERKALYRRLGDRFEPSRYDVAELSDDATARAFVQAHHYSGSYPAARFRFGLYDRSALVGVAVYSHPASDKVLTSVFPGRATDAAELGRLVLLDAVPTNAESWFVARTFELLRGRLRGVVSFSDDMPRTTADGSVVFAGHLGIVYQALNAQYRGRATARTLRLLPDGRVLSPRSLQKIRQQERGWQPVVARLQAQGAGPLDVEPAEWLRRELPRVTRPLRHPGNHRYVWGLAPAEKRRLRRMPSAPYPTRAAIEGVA
jgi:hypothetical protein